MRLSRPCYDKYQRCPGWAGGGLMHAKKHLCEDGSLQMNWDKKFWKYKFHSCNKCDVLVFPYIVRYIDARNGLRTFRHYLEMKKYYNSREFKEKYL